MEHQIPIFSLYSLHFVVYYSMNLEKHYWDLTWSITEHAKICGKHVQSITPSSVWTDHFHLKRIFLHIILHQVQNSGTGKYCLYSLTMLYCCIFPLIKIKIQLLDHRIFVIHIYLLSGVCPLCLYQQKVIQVLVIQPGLKNLFH